MTDRSHPNGETPPSNGRATEPGLGDRGSVHLLRTELTVLIGRTQLLILRLNGQDNLQRELGVALVALQQAAQHLLRLAEALPPAADPHQAADPPPSHPSANGDT